jgi:electron transfer flavoprotein alpha subunit
MILVIAEQRGGTLNRATWEALAAAQQLAEFMKSLVPAAADKMFVNGTVQSQGFAGVPVRRITFRNGAVESTTETTEFKRESLPASLFDPPAGYRKETMPTMGR